MSELVCLHCGKEMEYDWAPCPHCGWKAPEPWEDDPMKEEEPARPGLLSKRRPWIQWVAWLLLALAVGGFIGRFFHR